MKKITIVLACLCLASNAFSAEKKVRIMNLTPYKMTVNYQICEYSYSATQYLCGATKQLNFTETARRYFFEDIILPEDNVMGSSLVIVTTTKAYYGLNDQNIAAQNDFQEYDTQKQKQKPICYGSSNRDLITLDNLHTSLIYCNTTNKM